MDYRDDRVDSRGLTAGVDGSGYSVEVAAHLPEMPAAANTSATSTRWPAIRLGDVDILFSEHALPLESVDDRYVAAEFSGRLWRAVGSPAVWLRAEERMTGGGAVQPTMVVAVYEDDYRFVSGQSLGRPSFEAYWRQTHTRASELLNAGTTPLLRPLVDVEFRRFCRDSRVRPGSAAAFEAYAQRQVPRDELVEFDGRPMEHLRRLMVHERDVAAMMWACDLFLRAAVDQYGDEAKAWAFNSARRVLDAVLAGASAGDTIVFISKLGDGQPLGSYALTAEHEAGAASDARRDRTRLSTLLSASFIVPSSGALALRSERGIGTTVQVWEYAHQRFTPSEHGRLILEAPGGDEPSVHYIPGFELPQPS